MLLASIRLAGRITTTDSVPNTMALDLLPASGTLSILVASRSQRLSYLQAVTQCYITSLGVGRYGAVLRVWVGLF